MMNSWYSTLLALAALLSSGPASGAESVSPLPCGIYNEAAAPLVERDLETQSVNRSRYTMETKTTSGKLLSVEVKSVPIKMSGERDQVSIFLDGAPLAKTSHQDVPLYFEVHVDGAKYRVICVRGEER